MSWTPSRSEERDIRRRIGRIDMFGVSPDLSRSSELIMNEFERNNAVNVGKTLLLNVATTEWISEYRRTVPPLIVLDCEQARAIASLAKLDLVGAPPFFHFLEFSIRAAEVLVSAGEIGSARTIVSSIRKAGAAFDRDWMTPAPRFSIEWDQRLRASAALPIVAHGFVLGHELGHRLLDAEVQSDETSLLQQQIAKFYEENDSEPGKIMTQATFQSFIRPPIDVKISADGYMAGDATRGRFMMDHWDEMVAQQQQELFSDHIAIQTLSQICIAAGLHVEAALEAVIAFLMASDRLLQMRRIMDRTPRERRRAAVRFDESSLKVRITYLLHLARNPGLVGGGDHIKGYWSNAVLRKRLPYLERLYGKSSIADTNGHLARGAFCLSTGTNIPDEVTLTKQLEEMDDINRFHFSTIYVPFQFPRWMYNIEQCTPERTEGVRKDVAGYAAGLRTVLGAIFGVDTRTTVDESSKRNEIKSIRRLSSNMRARLKA
jgi:hypothetical protein